MHSRILSDFNDFTTIFKIYAANVARTGRTSGTIGIGHRATAQAYPYEDECTCQPMGGHSPYELLRSVGMPNQAAARLRIPMAGKQR
jgi:hypothetical protein